jgi:hypothetical protein
VSRCSPSDEEDIISLGGTPPPPVATATATTEEEPEEIKQQDDEGTMSTVPASETNETDANNATTTAEPGPESSHSEQNNVSQELQNQAANDAQPAENIEEAPKVAPLTRDRLNNILETRSAEATLLAESVSFIHCRCSGRAMC